jgi:catecholate siderophore receptor
MGEDMANSACVPQSLRRATRPLANPQDLSGKASLMTAACLLAAGPPTAALAQSTTASQGTLPPLSVEAKAAQKKAPTSPSSATGSAPAAPAPQPTPDEKASSPYVNPAAPYKVEQSASGKITEPLANAPKSITAISKEVLEDKAVTSVRELARQTPGVTIGFAEGGNAFGDSIYIRGFNARGDIFVDGMRDPGNASRDTFAVEQVEVYKGPSGTIAGRGVTGGAINLITKQPNEAFNFVDVTTMFGTDRTVRTIVDLNQVVSPGLAIRGNVMYDNNHVAERDDHIEDERWGGFVAATLKPTDAFKLTVDYYRYRTNGVPDFGVPFDPRTRLPVTGTAGVDRKTWYGLANPGRDFMKNEADIVTGTAEWKVADGVKLTSKTRAGRTTVDYLASSTEQTNIAAGGVPNPNPADWVTVIHNPNRLQQTDLLANQTDVTLNFATGGWRHTVVAGVEFGREETSQQSYTLQIGNKFNGCELTPVPAANCIGVFNPVGGDDNRITGLTLPIDRRIDTAAAYLLDTVKINPQWTVNGGIRLDHFERNDSGPPNANPNNDPNGSRQDTLFNWNVGIAYQPLPNATFYAAYATSSNPIGQELDATQVDYGGLALSLTGLKPEKNTAIEIGAKWELFDRRLLATAALFQTTKQNAREPSPLGGANPVTSTGEFRVRGVEFGAQGKLTERWSVYGGLVVMETEVTDSATPRYIGRELANIPKTQFNLLTKYALTENLTVGGQAVYASEVFGGLFAAGQTGAVDVFDRIPEHWRFDLLSEYKFTDNFSAQLNVVNVTNELYYDSLYRNATPFAFVAPGRAGYLILNWKY